MYLYAYLPVLTGVLLIRLTFLLKGTLLLGVKKLKEVNDILSEGIYGKKEPKAEEKREFLGTYRERIVLVLTKEQVREPGVYKEVQEKMKGNTNLTLLLNGKLAIKVFSNYIKMAEENKITYKIVTNLESDTNIGLVLADNKAVNNENIYVQQKERKIRNDQSFLGKLFGKK